MFTELRVHGVSGTPPRELLYTDPVTESAPDDYTKIYRVPGTEEGYDPEVRAFHWGGLTAGSWRTAFWILLAPFAFANAAGWLVSKRNKGTISSVRLAGLALTALFSSQALTAAVVVHGWFQIEGLTGWQLRGATFALFAGLAVLVFWVDGMLSLRSHFAPLGFWCRMRLLLWPSAKWLHPPVVDESNDDNSKRRCQPGTSINWTDPASPEPGDDSPWVTDGRLWGPHSILHRLRRPHFATAFAVVSIGLARALDLPDWVFWAGVGLIGLAGLIVVATTVLPEASWVHLLTAWVAPVALVVAAVLVVLTLFADVPRPGEWQGLHQTNLFISLAFGISSFLALAFGAGKAVGALAVGAFFGSAIGIASITVLERLTRAPEDNPLRAVIERQSYLSNGADWVAVWMLVLVLVLLVVASILSYIPVDPEPAERSEKGDVFVRLRRVVHRAQYQLWAAIAVGIVAAVTLSMFLCKGGDCRPANLKVENWGPVTWLLLVAAVALTAALWPVGKWIRLAVPLGVAALMLAARFGFLRFQILRIPVDLTRLVDASLAVAVLIPAGFIVRSIIGGLGDPEKRRKTGMLWDVASLWPRYFHPLGPPAYGPNAVTELKKELAGTDVTLSAHSQGSVVAAVALSQMSPAETQSLKQVITYGSPLRLIYAHMFPRAGFDRLLQSKGGHGGLEWHNLWRRSDYLGGLPLPLPDEAAANVEADYVGHSGYECTLQFRQVKAGAPVDPADEARKCGAHPV